MLCCEAVCGGGAEREQWHSLPSPPDFSLSLHYPQSNGRVFHSTTHNQMGTALWCWFLSGWACARPRPLWVSPTTSPVRLGVSPAAAPTPTGIFNQRFEALFPRAGALGCEVCFAPRCLSSLSVCKCGAAGSTSGQTACPFSPTLRQSRSPHGNAISLRPSARLRPFYWSG